MLKYVSKLFYLLNESKIKLFIICIVILLASLLETIGIGLIGPFMSLVTSEDAIESNQWLGITYKFLKLGSETQFIGLLGFCIVIIFYVKSFLKYYLQRYIFRFGYNNQGRLRLRLLQTYQALPYSYYLENNTAQLIQNILNETHIFSNKILIATLNTFVHLVILFFLILLLVFTDPIATISILIILLIVVYIYQRSKQHLAVWGRDLSQSQTEMIKVINHSMGSLKETRVIGCEEFFIDQLKRQVQKYSIAMSSALSFKFLPLVIVESLMITFLIGFTSLFLLLGREVETLIPILSIFALASIRIIPSVNQVFSGISGIRSASYSFNKLYYDLKELDGYDRASRTKLAEIKSQSYRHKLISFQGEIILQDVSYCYPGSSQAALKMINLTIKRGESIAFIGKSGAGKTTLVDVILGLLILEKGDILVDGHSIYQDIRSWQNLIGYIPQSIFIMDDTLEKNIAFGVPENLIDSDSLNKAIAAAQLTELVQELPAGLQTRVGERGVCLSGGQRQRVGIARALYHKRQIIVFDEATAALDSETENLVTESIKLLSGKKTTITIAHRLSTVEHCDCIYLIDNGQIIKSGSYAEVVLNQST